MSSNSDTLTVTGITISILIGAATIWKLTRKSANIVDSCISVGTHDASKLRDNFATLTKLYFDVDDDADWSRFDFSGSSVLKLRECVEKVRTFFFKFTRKDHPDLNSETIELMHAIESEIRRRPLHEQYPETEMWNPLKSVNAALDRMEARNGRQTKCWDAHFDGYLEYGFTDIALKYLRDKNPGNIYLDVIEECQLNRSRRVFEVDGLIYDKTANIFYMIDANFYLTESQLAKTTENFTKFCDFVKMGQPDHSARKSRFHWNLLFGYEGIVEPDIAAQSTVSVFLAFHESNSDDLITAAKSQNFLLIGPEGYLYKVLSA